MNKSCLLCDHYIMCEFVGNRHVGDDCDWWEGWHYLRTNENDLPEEGKRLLFVCNGTFWSGKFRHFVDESGKEYKVFENDDYEQYVTKGEYDVTVVAAWRYVNIKEVIR